MSILPSRRCLRGPAGCVPAQVPAASTNEVANLAADKVLTPNGLAGQAHWRSIPHSPRTPR
eukprot:5522408-Heterocapsa_arctica.AAC.1